MTHPDGLQDQGSISLNVITEFVLSIDLSEVGVGTNVDLGGLGNTPELVGQLTSGLARFCM